MALAACKGSPDEGPWCSAGQKAPEPASASLAWHRDAKPIFDQKCGRCHDEGGIAPLSLSTFADVSANLSLVRKVVAERTLPPFLAASCCSSYANDYSLTDDEMQKVLGWIDQGGPEGDPAAAQPPRPPIGGLSKVDISVKMKESYTPAPPSGTTDDTRCFVIDWPLDRAAYVTGLDPRPGNRSIVHHLIVGLVGPGDADDAVARDAKDPRPGFDCSGGFGDLRNVTSLGGSLLGGDFPRGIGALVEPGSKILLNVHYSTAKTTGADQTAIDFRVDDTARNAKTIVVANPLWLVGDAMEIPAGEKDAVFFYKFVPELFTGRKPVELQGVVPHMHYFATQVTVRALHKDGSRSCLLEIPRWEFGWEQPYWFAQPKRLEPEDEIYVECHFDNSAANQPAGTGPRDIAWGGDNQDMCSAFVTFTEVAE
jgi:hypothetical protein